MEFYQNKFITVTILFDYGRGSTCKDRDIYAFSDRGIEYTDDCYKRCHSLWCSYRESTLIEYQGKTYSLTYTNMATYFPKWISEKYDVADDYIELDDIVL
jgi:hypothetical protein